MVLDENKLARCGKGKQKKATSVRDQLNFWPCLLNVSFLLFYVFFKYQLLNSVNGIFIKNSVALILVVEWVSLFTFSNSQH